MVGVRGRLANLAAGNFNILLLQSRDHVRSGEAVRCQQHRVEPHTHGVFALAEDHHVAHTGHALKSVFDVDVEVVGDELAGVAPVEREKSGAKDKVEIGFDDRDAGGIHLAGQTPLHAGHPVLHVYRGNIEIVTGIKGDGDLADAAVGARRTDVAHPLNAVDGFLKRNRDGFLDGFRVRADVGGRDHDRGRRQRGIHGYGKIRNAHRASQDDEQCAYRRKHGPADKEIDEQGRLSFRCGAPSSELRAPPEFGGIQLPIGATGMLFTRNWVPETMTRCPVASPEEIEYEFPTVSPSETGSSRAK